MRCDLLRTYVCKLSCNESTLLGRSRGWRSLQARLEFSGGGCPGELHKKLELDSPRRCLLATYSIGTSLFLYLADHYPMTRYFVLQYEYEYNAKLFGLSRGGLILLKREPNRVSLGYTLLKIDSSKVPCMSVINREIGLDFKHFKRFEHFKNRESSRVTLTCMA